jgi:hypothetical protein
MHSAAAWPPNMSLRALPPPPLATSPLAALHLAAALGLAVELLRQVSTAPIRSSQPAITVSATSSSALYLTRREW